MPKRTRRLQVSRPVSTMARARRSGVKLVGAEELVLESIVEVRRGAIGYRDRGGRTKVETEKEKEEKTEKARAAAWAWYEHGKGGGKESLSRSRTFSSGESKLIVRSGEPGHKSSRFKMEAVKTTSGHLAPAEAHSHMRTASGRGWDMSNSSLSESSSLFDAYELGHVSKRIETAVQGCGSTSPSSGLTALGPGLYIVHQSQGPTVGRPPRKPCSGTSARMAPKVITAQDKSQELTSSPKLTKSSTFRSQFPRYICSSLNGVVPYEEMTHSVDIAKHARQKAEASTLSDGSGWSLRRNSRVHSLPRVCVPSSKGASRAISGSTIDPPTPVKVQPS